MELFDACATCEGGVIDLRERDPERCGAAEVHCENDEYCVAGLCVCRPPLSRIGEDCVDTSTDPEHCGGEGRVCEVCAAGACAASCPGGTLDCEGACVDPSDHPLHCGECGRPCGAGQLCVAGVCQWLVPAPCTACPCACPRACCAYPGYPSDTICVDADSC